MTQEQILEGNRLIMESPFAADHHKKWMDKLTKYEGKPDTAFKEAKYHSSWDWLMPVVEKIEKLGYDSRIIGNDSDGGYLCDFVDASNNEISQKINYHSKIKAVWDAVVDFVKWYNSNTQTKQQ